MLGNEKNPCCKLSRFHEKNSCRKLSLVTESGIYYHIAILQNLNLSEQDICFDRKYLIGRERNAVDLYDQRGSKGQISFISFKEGFPLDHLQLARNVLNRETDGLGGLGCGGVIGARARGRRGGRSRP